MPIKRKILDFRASVLKMQSDTPIYIFLQKKCKSHTQDKEINKIKIKIKLQYLYIQIYWAHLNSNNNEYNTN